MAMDDMSDEALIQVMEAQRAALVNGDFDLLTPIEIVAVLWWRLADFHLYITSPLFERFLTPKVLLPEQLPNSEQYEFVYPIVDFGDQLSTSKGEDGYAAGFSMCKLYFTIEKMIAILIERLKEGGTDEQAEVQIALGGHEYAQRKGFESIINLKYNVVVTNFDPGDWGEKYLENVKQLSEKGYGYPSEAPRDTYRQPSISRGR
ncbi:MAG: virulence factor [Legionellaceae bacterium]|nr:virulence factor [Legionellaceae bacterium]